MEIKDIKAGEGKIDVTGEVTEIAEPKSFEKYGKQGKLANAILKDDSGEIKLTLWNEQVDQVKEGDKIHITNGYVSEWKGEKQLSTGKFGKLEIVK